MANPQTQQKSATAVVAEVIETGFSDALPGHLDVFLVWLSATRADGQNVIDGYIERSRISRRQTARQIRLAIDRALFAPENASPYQTLGLDPGADPATVKLRYQRLIKIYHPDKENARADWLTRRTEAINSAFRAVKNGRVTDPKPGGHGAAPQAQTPPVERPAPRRRPERPGRTVWAEKLRRALGRPEQFEKRVLGALFAVCLLVILLTYLLGGREHQPPPVEEYLTGLNQLELSVGWGAADGPEPAAPGPERLVGYAQAAVGLNDGVAAAESLTVTDPTAGGRAYKVLTLPAGHPRAGFASLLFELQHRHSWQIRAYPETPLSVFLQPPALPALAGR